MNVGVGMVIPVLASVRLELIHVVAEGGLDRGIGIPDRLDTRIERHCAGGIREHRPDVDGFRALRQGYGGIGLPGHRVEQALHFRHVGQRFRRRLPAADQPLQGGVRQRRRLVLVDQPGSLRLLDGAHGLVDVLRQLLLLRQVDRLSAERLRRLQRELHRLERVSLVGR